MRVPRVLMVEDNLGDVELLRFGFLEIGLRATVERVPTGHQAIARLEGAEPYQGLPMPELVVLDIHLPGLLGHELLSLIRDDERLRDLPVAVLTASTDAQDAEICRARGADAFLIKPFRLRDCVEVARVIAGLLGDPSLAGRRSRDYVIS
jgi:CheY-like chemotaxis protein